MGIGWWQFARLLGWAWMPAQWLWRGCFDGEAAVECFRQGWKEYRATRLIRRRP
jgi:hypothetical protein